MGWAGREPGDKRQASRRPELLLSPFDSGGSPLEAGPRDTVAVIVHCGMNTYQYTNSIGDGPSSISPGQWSPMEMITGCSAQAEGICAEEVMQRQPESSPSPSPG